VSYYKAVPSPRPPAQTTTVEIVSIPNPTNAKTPAGRLLDSSLSQHSSHSSLHKPSPAPFVVQHHPQNPWQGMSPVRDAHLGSTPLATEVVLTPNRFQVRIRPWTSSSQDLHFQHLTTRLRDPCRKQNQFPTPQPTSLDCSESSLVMD